MTTRPLDATARGQAVLVMGKGGVGKTTVAAALAVREVAQKGRAVLVEFGDGASVRRALGAVQGVTHVVVQPDEALRRGAMPLFGSAAIARLVLDNFAVRPLLRAAPAVREIAMLESVRQIVEQHRGVRVFVDMPATGHSVAWLRTARQGRDFLGAGPLFDLCDRVARELVAPGRAIPIIVTLPELLVLEETRELCTALAQELDLEVAAIVVNRVPQGFGADVLSLTRGLIAQAAPPLAAALTPLAALLEARAALSAEASQAVATFSAGATAVWRLPLAAVDPTAPEVAAWLDAAGGDVKPVNVIVCVGGGGVGKTTTSAAIALALARQGHRALIVTIDPARRLAGALGVTISDRLTPIPLLDTTGSLTALMPDPRRSMGTLIDYLFEHEPAARERVLKNSLYIGLCDAAAGVHELVAMNLVAQAAAQDQFDTIVIDTAPSRHAIDFVTYPGRLATLLGGRAVSWLANLTRRAATPPGTRPSWLARATGQVENLLARVTGPNLLRDTAALFSDLALIRERFLELTRRASELLLGEHVAYALVAAPTAAARDDVQFLAERLAKLGRQPRVIVMNRAAAAPEEWLRTLTASAGLPAALVTVLAALARELSARKSAADTHVAELRRLMPRTPILRLAYVEATAPEVVVEALARAVTVHLPQLLPSK